MTEKVILLEGVDPVELYGAGHSNIAKISAKFPKLKIIARGSSVKVMGEASEIGRFEQKLTDLIDYYGRYGHLSGEVIDQVYDGGMPKRDETADKDAIVFGNNGVIVRARTVNQQKLVQLYEHNDLLFAVGGRVGYDQPDLRMPGRLLLQFADQHQPPRLAHVGLRDADDIPDLPLLRPGPAARGQQEQGGAEQRRRQPPESPSHMAVPSFSVTARRRPSGTPSGRRRAPF